LGANQQVGIADNARAYYYSQRRINLRAAIYYRIEIYLFEINFSGHTSHFCCFHDDRVMFLRPATTLNRLYFNHD
jgi:hypothetical protein